MKAQRRKYVYSWMNFQSEYTHVTTTQVNKGTIAIPLYVSASTTALLSKITIIPTSHIADSFQQC